MIFYFWGTWKICAIVFHRDNGTIFKIPEYIKSKFDSFEMVVANTINECITVNYNQCILPDPVSLQRNKESETKNIITVGFTVKQ